MRVMTIEQVVHEDAALEHLLGRSIDLPQAGQTTSVPFCSVQGWALGRAQRVLEMEARIGDRIVSVAPPRLPRPDLVAIFPNCPTADRAGYQLQIELPVSGTHDIEIRAVLADRTSVRIGSLRARTEWKSDTTPLVSIVIPCYGQAHFLGDAIESALSQTYPHLEILVIDDGSPDNASEVANRYGRVRCVRQGNRGLGAARNHGLRRTLGDMLVFLDSDDRLLPNALQSALDCFAANPDAAYVVGQVRLIDFAGRTFGSLPEPFLSNDHFNTLLAGRSITTPGCVMFRRSAFNQVGVFSEARRYRGCEDYDLCLRIARQFHAVSHPDVVLDYRQHGSNMTSRRISMIRSVRAVHAAQWRYARTRPDWTASFARGVDFWKQQMHWIFDDLFARQELTSSRWEYLRLMAELAITDPMSCYRRLRSGRTERATFVDRDRPAKAA